ncbi:response regulator [Paenibacillus sp. 2TAB23]|uniref:response regulator n=1 Tax=Paenibacillus sp. 2TAB23 TaxID=3233004 RepID=UPI003F9A4D12
MLKAVVFDDEYIVLQGLQTMINWSLFGIELNGTASDGLSALELFRKVRPDIILTDIRMPGMNGLELIEAVMREAPETYCIVFSGFNEFEYVRRAIQLGVADYLDKPITIASIEKAIRKVQEKFTERQQTLAIKRRWDDTQLELLEKSILDLLLIGDEAMPKWADFYGEDAKKVTGVTVIAYSGHFMLSKHEDYDAINIRYGQEKLIVVFHFGAPAGQIWDKLEYEFDQTHTSMGIGSTYKAPGKAADSYKEAIRALRSATLLDTTGIVRFDELGVTMTVPKGILEWEESMILSIRAGNKAGIMEQIEQFIRWVQLEKPDPEIVEREMLKFIYRALQAAKESGLNHKADEFQSRYMPHLEIQHAAVRGQVLQWFRDQMHTIADLSIESREKTKHSTVNQARVFIEQNLHRDLSLQEVADYVGLNATYLSVLFKDVVGESYIKFLTRCRMEKAKTWLLRGMKVNEVSDKVGYHTYRHFSEVFKKSTGLTPGQYKEERGNQGNHP